MRKITPRKTVIDKLDNYIGDTFPISVSPTGRGKLLYYEKDKAYYEVAEHEEYTKYNYCAGQVFYLKTQMAVTIEPLKG